MNERPPVLAAVPAPDPSLSGEAKPADPGALLERHHKYADDFAVWLKGLNRADFMQAKKVLEAMTKAYFRHTVKIHSPPAKDKNDVPGPTSDRAPSANVPGASDQQPREGVDVQPEG